jgi:hypothetical protein
MSKPRIVHVQGERGSVVYVVVKYYPEWEEYIAHLFVRRVERVASAYHTSDLGDAVSTSHDMCRSAHMNLV